MSLVVLEEGSVPIPEDLAQEYGIHKGSPIEWERTSDGRLTLRTLSSRREAARRLRGMFAHTLKPGRARWPISSASGKRPRSWKRRLDPPSRHLSDIG